jgi:protein MpaA
VSFLPGISGRIERLGKNREGYFGETIDIDAVMRRIQDAAKSHLWEEEVFLDNPGCRLIALKRASTPVAQGRPFRVYLSAGIHGDEPAGPLAVRRLIEQNEWPGNAEIWLCPCLNPGGIGLNRRENPEGTDLNRQYLQPKATETIAHIAWLQKQPSFDLCLCLHEDWEAHGFYIYELSLDETWRLAEGIIARVAEVCPIDPSEIIEGRPASAGIIRPSVDPRTRPQWPESFYLLTHKTRLSYTFEAPSDFPIPARVAALVTGVHAALAQMTEAWKTAPKNQD